MWEPVHYWTGEGLLVLGFRRFQLLRRQVLLMEVLLPETESYIISPTGSIAGTSAPHKKNGANDRHKLTYLATDLVDSRSFALRSGKLPDYIYTLTPEPSMK